MNEVAVTVAVAVTAAPEDIGTGQTYLEKVCDCFRLMIMVVVMVVMAVMAVLAVKTNGYLA